MTTTIERAKSFAGALEDAQRFPVRRDGEANWVRWMTDVLPEGTAWMRANADILPRRMDVSWRQMDNGPLLTLQARDVEDVADLLAVAYALSDRFGVGVSMHQPSRLGTVGVSVERISMDGFRAGALRIDFSGSVRTAVTL
ncbi:MAG: hypothetical protein HOY79_20820 [Streptomyces sp.]|nr:hypothetical protein [Streptomyces sp.]